MVCFMRRGRTAEAVFPLTFQCGIVFPHPVLAGSANNALRQYLLKAAWSLGLKRLGIGVLLKASGNPGPRESARIHQYANT